MCEFCEIEEYRGKILKLSKNVDGKRQQFDAYIFDSPEDECHVIRVDGEHTELRIDIQFCPICGKFLN